MSQRLLNLAGSVNTASIRTAMFNGQEHLVVPVVALMEGVIWPSNAQGKEFVPAEVLAAAPAGWNGRPVLPNHPDRDGQPVSANIPEILEGQAFGMVFNTAMDGKKLVMEAWLDANKAGKVGALAQKVLQRARNKEVIEVSVGALVVADAVSGEYNGEAYTAVWREVIPDHLAMLPEGVPGACSVDMGCGAPRAAAAAQESRMENPKPSLRERLMSLMRFISNAGAEADLSDQDLRQLLHAALNADEPGFLGVDSVFPADGTVIYAVAPAETLTLFRRGYALADGKVELKNDREEVRPVTRYESVTASQNTGTCGCADTTTTTNLKEGDMNKQDRIKALIACPKTPFTEADLTALEAMTEDRLTALEAHFSATTVTEAPKPQTTEELLAAHPEIAAIVNEHKASQLAKKTALVTALKAKQTVYNETELNEMGVASLEKLALLTKVEEPAPNFAGQALPRDNSAHETIDAPPSLASKLSK